MTKTLVLASLLLSTGCLEEPAEDVGSQEFETAPAGITQAVLGVATIRDAEFALTWRGEFSSIETEEGAPMILILQEVNFQPGGHTGWHTHGGPLPVLVTAGTLTIYHADAPCDGEDFPAGTAFFDGPGHGVHLAKNNGTTPAQVRGLVTQASPGAPLRIDAPRPPGAELCGN